MTNNYYARYYAIEEALENDEELNHLKQRLQQTEQEVRAIMPNLTEEQHQILTEYLGICAEIDQRIVEIASFSEN